MLKAATPPDRKFGTPSAEPTLESIPRKASLVVRDVSRGPDVVICSLASQASSEPVSREQRPPATRAAQQPQSARLFLSLFFFLCLLGACCRRCPGKMSKVQMLRALVNERLSAAVEEVFAVLERTIADYEEELCRTKEENRRQRQLLDAVFKPQAEDAHAPDAQGCPRVKEEEEEAAAEQADDADLGKLAVTCVVVKSEDEGRAESEEKTASDGDAAEREGAGGLFACPRCDKTYGSRRHLKRHAKSHADAEGLPPRGEPGAPPAQAEPPFSCSACNVTFKFQSTFLGHMRKHSGGKSFPCGVCNATFRFRSTFVNHMRTHTGEKPFACQVCNASFGVHSSLLRHARLHTGEKRFACSFCDKKFPRKASLVEHVRIHTGEKPLSCSVCHMSFRFHSKLVKHMRSHKGDQALDCPACGQTFESRLRLDKHACAGGESGRAQTRFKV
ncbi:zinc finger protein GLI4-like isoform X2 [Hippocampus comes]|uniref:zinc finger protein GLI4-like isoform X1 n=1 Tax=Hippocampus comes TaxID=109280 RepID=UPI00094F2DB6|nr:PREDICTED: zinc finger protein GLI4-like isoform X1 [Hippocampus comes]XP_019748775.1 PREDICTED: zinc finger protein GLI4-like isoform X2 [Hippocampus comes]